MELKCDFSHVAMTDTGPVVHTVGWGLGWGGVGTLSTCGQDYCPFQFFLLLEVKADLNVVENSSHFEDKQLAVVE